MADQIFVESIALREASTSVAAIIQNINSINDKISALHNTKHSNWRGRAATKDNENFETLRNMTKKYLEDANATKIALDEAINEYARIEQSQQTQVRNLKTANVFN
ncbi:MAG: WXG100 family type VII secretion target [Firmicutes bacterium]|nr:WXG100 family type VII secretion target [Bacillota bacterium]